MLLFPCVIFSRVYFIRKNVLYVLRERAFARARTRLRWRGGGGGEVEVQKTFLKRAWCLKIEFFWYTITCRLLRYLATFRNVVPHYR